MRRQLPIVRAGSQANLAHRKILKTKVFFCYTELMLNRHGVFELSAFDLVGHLGCRFLTALNHEVAMGHHEKPAFWDPLLDLLRERTTPHEQADVDHLQSAGY